MVRNGVVIGQISGKCVFLTHSLLSSLLLILSLFTLNVGGRRTWSLDLLSDFVTCPFDFRRAMRKFIGLASTKSDDELLSLSLDGPLFKGLDGEFGPLRSGLKDRARLKEREAKAELLARNGHYGEADEVEEECSKVRGGLALIQAEFAKAESALRLAKARKT